MADQKSWTVEVVEDPETGDLILPLNEEILEGVGWQAGDSVEWIDNKDGTWSLRKVEQEWVLVECAHTFRMRYMVQVPKGKSEWALDTVTCEEAKEFSQEFIGQQIMSHRVVTEDEAIAICDIDNDYCSKWTREQKMKAFFTKEGEKVEL